MTPQCYNSYKERRDIMTHFTGDYYVFEDELYRKVKMTPKGYHLKDKKGKLQWISIKKIKDILDQRKKK